MMTSHAHLRLVPPAREDLPVPGLAGGDLALLVFVLAVHAIPLVGLAAGGTWGAATVGYAAAVTLVSGSELVRELRQRARGGCSR